MINKKIFNIIGYILLFLAISMLFSLSWSFYDNSNDFGLGGKIRSMYRDEDEKSDS